MGWSFVWLGFYEPNQLQYGQRLHENLIATRPFIRLLQINLTKLLHLLKDPLVGSDCGFSPWPY
jgi:hypothetical protein